MKSHLAMLAVVLAAVLGGSAGGQTTQPADEPWPRAVEQFAQALIDGNADEMRLLLADDAVVRPFGSAGEGGAGSELNRLLAVARQTTLVGAHAYVHPPLVMAADIAVDCKNAAELPDDLRQRMIPQDDVEIKRANATAVQWLSLALEAVDGEWVGVVAVFVPGEPLAGSTTPPETLSGEMMFVLLKGEVVAGEGDEETTALVRQVVYGNPLTMP